MQQLFLQLLVLVLVVESALVVVLVWFQLATFLEVLSELGLVLVLVLVVVFELVALVPEVVFELVVSVVSAFE
jgi:hypothetical protein